MKESDAGSLLQKAISLLEGSSTQSSNERMALIQVLTVYQTYLKGQGKEKEAQEALERLAMAKEKTTPADSFVVGGFGAIGMGIAMSTSVRGGHNNNSDSKEVTKN